MIKYLLKVYFMECCFLLGNDCAITVAMHIGGTIENFANMMNKKAEEIGVFDTSFANPHGLDNAEHYSSALSLALIARYALNNKYINEAVNTTSATINFGSFSKLLNNTNALLKTYDKADGVKTGFTNGANKCLIASATDNGRRYISVVLGAETTNIRFSAAKELLEHSFKIYKNYDISNFLNLYINIPVIKGNISNYERTFNANMTLPLTEDEYNKISIEQWCMPSILPPLDIGTKIATLKLKLDDEILYEKDFFLDKKIYRKTFSDYFKESLKNMFEDVF